MMRSGRGRGFGTWAAAVIMLAGWTAPAAAQARTHTLIVVGLGGTAEYRQTFHDQARTLRTALVERHGVSAEDVVYLGERTELDPGIIDDRSTRDNVLGALERMARSAGPTDRTLIVLIGHGTSGPGGESFNIPGPDVSPADFVDALRAFGERPVAFVHTGSGSGAYLDPLAAPGRVVITATRSGRELNATRFAEHFVAALSSDGADIDRDGTVSLLEAYTYARDEVARYYATQNQIQTENAVLADGAIRLGVQGATDRPATDTPLANRFAFGGRATTDVPETDDPVLGRLYRERAAIQARVDELRTLSGTLPEDVYLSRMEDLLVELALKNREIQAAGGGAR